MTSFLSCAIPYSSTGKERDSESGNDYFEARYYSSAMGRFMSPDWSAKEDPVPYAQLDDPQSLNLYSYVRNNPLARTDPDGHCGPTDPFDCALMLQAVGDIFAAGLKEWAHSTVNQMMDPSPAGRIMFATNSTMLAMAPEALASGEEVGVRTDAAESESAVTAVAGEAAASETAGPSEAYYRRQHYGDTPTAADRKAIGGNQLTTSLLWSSDTTKAIQQRGRSQVTNKHRPKEGRARTTGRECAPRPKRNSRDKVLKWREIQKSKRKRMD